MQANYSSGFKSDKLRRAYSIDFLHKCGINEGSFRWWVEIYSLSESELWQAIEYKMSFYFFLKPP